MKRIFVFLITAGAALIIANQSKAQVYYTTTYTSYSYDNYNDWDLPYHVRNVVVNNYGGCGIVNARSYYVNGYLSYNLFLHTDNTYVEVEVDRFGYVTRRVLYNAFPTQHVWVNNYSTYYKPKHHHHGNHYGHDNHGNHHHKSYGEHTVNNYYIDYSDNDHHKSNSYGSSTNERPELMRGRSDVTRDGKIKIRENHYNRYAQSNMRTAKKENSNNRNSRPASGSYAYYGSRTR